jgi:hypothetical protein
MISAFIKVTRKKWLEDRAGMPFQLSVFITWSGMLHRFGHGPHFFRQDFFLDYRPRIARTSSQHSIKAVTSRTQRTDREFQFYPLLENKRVARFPPFPFGD